MEASIMTGWVEGIVVLDTEVKGRFAGRVEEFENAEILPSDPRKKLDSIKTNVVTVMNW